MRKFVSTIRIAVCIIAARTFGTYEHSGWTHIGADEGLHYARYRFRGQTWLIPTQPVEDVGP